MAQPIEEVERKLMNDHPDHRNHLCELARQREMARIGQLARGAKYVCHICGRAAARAENLCEPVEISSAG